MAKAELYLDLEEELGPLTRVEIETDQLKRPLLERAGIIDLDHAFNLMPESLVAPFRQDSRIGYFHSVYPFLFEMQDQICKTLGAWRTTASPFRDENEHFMFPLAESGFIHELSRSKLFMREFGVAQLGLLRFYPLPNSQTRGEHSIYITVDMMRTLQTLHDIQPELLESRLRSDLASEPFYSPDMTSLDLFDLAVDLTVLSAMEHDQATPAGGDTIKYLLHLDEEADVEWLFFGDHQILAAERAEFLALLQKRNLNTDHLRFAIRCIQGDSTSLIGDMLHPTGGDYLDWDRIGYTKLDCEAARMLGNEIPGRLVPYPFTAYDSRALESALIAGVEALNSDAQAVVGLGILDYVTGEAFFRPSTTLIDPVDDFRLDPGGRLVNIRPDKLAWIAAFRIYMTANHYAGGKMLGVETQFQRKLAELISQGLTGNILTREHLMTVTTAELYKDLLTLGDPELTALIHSFDGVFSNKNFKSRIVPRDQDHAPAWATYPVKVKPGFDTLVSVDGATTTLGQYLSDNPSSVPAQLAQEGMMRYSNSKVVIDEA